MQPAPDDAVADARHEARALGMPRRIGPAQTGQRQSQGGRQLSSQCLDINDEFWGKSPGTTWAGSFFQARQSLHEEALSPLTDHLPARVKPAAISSLSIPAAAMRIILAR
jgi:hypothetical protein